jgi:hypothetical protein
VTEPWPATPEPPQLFKPETTTVEVGQQFYRVHPAQYGATEFNPGGGNGGRFHFFGSPKVPVLYMAQTPVAAIAETLLHDLPVDTHSRLRRRNYAPMVLSKIEVRRPLRVAAFLGMGLWQLGVEASQLTATPTSRYPLTRAWAQAAHEAQLDGVVWMSRRCNNDMSFVLFGGPVASEHLLELPDDRIAFGTREGRDWLVQVCSRLPVDIAP